MFLWRRGRGPNRTNVRPSALDVAWFPRVSTQTAIRTSSITPPIVLRLKCFFFFLSPSLLQLECVNMQWAGCKGIEYHHWNRGCELHNDLRDFDHTGNIGTNRDASCECKYTTRRRQIEVFPIEPKSLRVSMAVHAACQHSKNRSEVINRPTQRQR